MNKIIFLLIILYFSLCVALVYSEIPCHNEDAAYASFMMACQIGVGNTTEGKKYCNCIFFETTVYEWANSKCEYDYRDIDRVLKNITTKRLCGHLEP